MNMEILKRTRSKPKQGDIFVYKFKQEGYFRVGLLVRDDASVHAFKNTILIYLYNATSKDKNHLPKLDKDNLLVPPIHTNYRSWTMGYFEVVGNIKINSEIILEHHHFKDLSSSINQHYDDESNIVENPIEPIGVFALHSFKSIDHELSKILGYSTKDEN